MNTINELTELSNLSTMIPEKSLLFVVQAAARASRTATGAFRFRGLCAFEVVARVKKLRGGRGKRDQKGRGRMSYLEKIASYCGVGLKTLITDAKIHAVFFTPDVIETTLAHESSLSLRFGLPRGYFVVSAYTTAPLAALKIAVDKLRVDTSYSIKAFEDDVRHLRPRAAENSDEVDRTLYLRVRLTADLDAALQELSGREQFVGKSVAEIAAATILHVHRINSVGDAVQAVMAKASEVERQSKSLKSNRPQKSSKKAERKDASDSLLF